MAEYYALIARAVADLGTSTAASRDALYDRVRKAQAAQLGKLNPPLSDSDLARERESLESAILAVDLLALAKEHAASDARIVADYATFLEDTKTRPDCFYDASVLPHPRRAILGAIERQIIQEPLDARVELLRVGSAWMWNFLDGVGPTPLPLGGIDLGKLSRASAPEELKRIAMQITNESDESVQRAKQLDAIADQELKNISKRIAAAVHLRTLLLDKVPEFKKQSSLLSSAFAQALGFSKDAKIKDVKIGSDGNWYVIRDGKRVRVRSKRSSSARAGEAIAAPVSTNVENLEARRILILRLAYFASFAIAVVLVVWMRSLGYGWVAALATAVGVWLGVPFVISQLHAAFVLTRAHRHLGRVNPFK
jgi:hypothetical protein